MKTDLELAVAAEIADALASRLANLKTRQEKSKEAAAYLFFQHGIYPSAKTVHSYTQQGSLTDINKDLQSFWENLRSQTRVKLDVPSIPANILAEFSTALEKLWEMNAHQAKRALDDERLAVKMVVATEQRNSADSERLRLMAETKVLALEEALQAERIRREGAEKTQEVQLSDIASLKEALNDCRVSLEQQTQARAQAEARFSGDLADERLARQKEAEQFHSEINFAKMQIETARQAERELREQLKTERAQKDGELSSYRQRANSGADALAVLRLEFAELKGSYAGMVMRCTELQSLLKEPLKQRVRPAPLRPAARTVRNNAAVNRLRK